MADLYSGRKRPPCVGCGEIEYMFLETANSDLEKWHCRNCTTKTTKYTAMGKARPQMGTAMTIFSAAISLIGFFKGHKGNTPGGGFGHQSPLDVFHEAMNKHKR